MDKVDEALRAAFEGTFDARLGEGLDPLDEAAALQKVGS
jgi:hypothetical protein